MKAKIFKGLFVLAIIVSALPCRICAQENAKEKKSLGLEQIAGDSIPSGIIDENFAVPVAWNDNDNILMWRDKCFNIRTGKMCASDAKKKFSEAYLKLIEESANYLRSNIFNGAKLNNMNISPDSSRFAYTCKGDLYVFTPATKKNVRLTNDGSSTIQNGRASWVYYEEILGRASRYKAYWWSPDGQTIAFYRFDDSKVPMFPIYDPSSAKDQIRETRYPMAGEKNPEVKIGFVSADGGAVVWADFNEKDDQYFGIPFWNANGTKFIIPWMPRVQQNLTFYSVNPLDGSKESIYKEHQETWIDWPEQMLFVKEGFYMARDFSMWDEIYYQSFDGKTLKQITDGKNWGIKFIKLDEKRGELYFTAKREISTRTDFYKVNVKTHKITRLSSGDYSYDRIMLSPDFKHFAAVCSNSSTPSMSVFAPTDGSGKLKVISNSKGADFEKYNLALPQMVYIKTKDGYTIPAKITWPVNMDTTKKYPVIIYMYGGPNTPMVEDNWSGVGRSTQWWANQGVIQMTMDHRASGHCGKEGVNFMYRKFLTIELQDFEEWAEYLYSKPYVNRDKIGIHGFSYGGTMTTLCVTEYSKYFKYGIAGGGVYDYKLYDTHYTERYMDTPQHNPQGYDNTVVSRRIANYKGDSTNFLMITHGAADDNVHIQNTMSLVLAMQNAGKQFDLMIYPEQLHGYRGKQGQFSTVSDYRFWYRHLLDKEAPAVLTKAVEK